MKVEGEHYRTIWLDELNQSVVHIIDQRQLPHHFIIEDIKTSEEMAIAIKEMHVRGAGLIGAAAAYGMYLATLERKERGLEEEFIESAAILLKETRPTAVNLSWAVDRQLNVIKGQTAARQVEIALTLAQSIADEDAAHCKKIGEHGVALIERISSEKNGDPVNILTHCNAGWLAFVDHGSATSPIYEAYDRGVNVHVWVDETRPRNQGARLTAWELGQHGIPHTVIADNTGGLLMQKGMVDIVIVGSDRTTYTGDVANKIGTYLKALAAHDNNVPFYVALPSSTFDWELRDGVSDIPIEERGSGEVKYISGLSGDKIASVLLTPQGSPALNYGFDVTPSRLVTGLITERGICEANEGSILSQFPEKKITV